MPDSLARRIGASVPAIAGGLVLLAVLWLLPDLTPGDAVPVIGQRSEHARIVESLGTDAAGLPLFAVEVVETGERLEAIVQDGSAAIPGSGNRAPYEVGDEVVLTRFTGPAAGTFAVIAEPWRLPLLGLGAAAFAAAVIVIGGLRGARSIVALALTLAVVVKLVVPLLLRGFDPILLAVGGGALVTLATLLLTEGPGRVTLSALLGTLAALGVTALLAATVFGALGVLDDVTVTQAATVEQLHRARPEADRRGVIGRAMHVGRAHIAATVNTLVLAYLGASLPLLLLFALSGQAPLIVLNGEVVAVEVIRALVGSIGIVAAVPLTTLVAAWLMVPAGHGGEAGG